MAAAAATSAHAETAPIEKAGVAPVEMEVKVPVDEADNPGAEGRAYCLESTLPPLHPLPPLPPLPPPPCPSMDSPCPSADCQRPV